METKPDYIVPPESITIPRPEDIKVTVKHPTIEELRTYRAAWLKEAESNGMIGDLFLIVKTFGAIPEDSPYPGWPALRRFEFTDGDSDYVILYDCEVWGRRARLGEEGESILTWERIFVVEGGDHMREVEYGNKRLVKYFRRLEPSLSGRDERVRDGEKITDNFYVPGHWEGLIGVFAGDARHEINKGKKEKVDSERKNLLNDLFHGQEGKTK